MKRAMQVMQVTVVTLVAVTAAGLLAGCVTIGDSRTDALDSAKQLLALSGQKDKVDVFAGKLGYSTASGVSAPLVRDVYVDNAGTVLSNGVRRVKTYQSVEDVVPAVSVNAGVPVLPPAVPASVPGATNSLGSLLP